MRSLAWLQDRCEHQTDTRPPAPHLEDTQITPITSPTSAPIGKPITAATNGSRSAKNSFGFSVSRPTVAPMTAPTTPPANTEYRATPTRVAVDIRGGATGAVVFSIMGRIYAAPTRP